MKDFVSNNLFILFWLYKATFANEDNGLCGCTTYHQESQLACCPHSLCDVGHERQGLEDAEGCRLVSCDTGTMLSTANPANRHLWKSISK